MTKTILITVISLGIFALAGCGKTSEDTNTTVTNTAVNGNTAKANTAPTKSEEPAKNVLKPGDVSPDKVFKVRELLDTVVADREGWKGKEVTVTGFVSPHTEKNTSGAIAVMLQDDPDKVGGGVVSCALKGVDFKDFLGKTVEVKGKIDGSNLEGGKLVGMALEPCVVKK